MCRDDDEDVGYSAVLGSSSLRRDVVITVVFSRWRRARARCLPIPIFKVNLCRVLCVRLSCLGR